MEDNILDGVKVKMKDNPVTRIYDERKDFIIIGLTGRTGSGCTTVSKILASKFQDFELPVPKTMGFSDNEERKYAVIHKYANENWPKNSFIVISITTIISSFLFENGFKKFTKYLKSIYNNDDIFHEMTEIEESFNTLQNNLQNLKYDDEHDKVIDLYTEQIPKTSLALKTILRKYSISKTSVKDPKNPKKAELYTHVFQEFGNNIRASGDPYNPEFNFSYTSKIADRTNKVVKSIRKSKKAEEHTLICIDAIRNKYEATFFQDRYSNFYLFSVNTEENHRKSRLSHLTNDEIENLDIVEYGQKEDLMEDLYKQNIGSCIEIADVHLHNPNNDDETLAYLTKQIIRYITLIMHPGLVTPTHVERCMQIANDAKINSGCLSRQVGATITDDNYSIKAVGWNSVPEGQIECSLRDLINLQKNKDSDTYSQYEIVDKSFKEFTSKLCKTINYDNLKGRFHPYCFKDCYNAVKAKGGGNQVHTRSLHAEENAFLQIVKYGGQGIKGGYLFTTASPCELCSKKAYQLGIKKVYYIDPYPGISQEHILNFGKENNPELILFRGAVGRAYTILYSQRLPYKDELSLLTTIRKDDLMEIFSRKDEGSEIGN